MRSRGTSRRSRKDRRQFRLSASLDPHPRVTFLPCPAHGPLPRSYPQVLTTIGDHLRKRRLDLGLLQREVAERLGVDKTTITNWELNRTTPALRFLPPIIALASIPALPA